MIWEEWIEMNNKRVKDKNVVEDAHYTVEADSRAVHQSLAACLQK